MQKVFASSNSTQIDSSGQLPGVQSGIVQYPPGAVESQMA